MQLLIVVVIAGLIYAFLQIAQSLGAAERQRWVERAVTTLVALLLLGIGLRGQPLLAGVLLVLTLLLRPLWLARLRRWAAANFGAEQASPVRPSGAMNREQALSILGLQEGASAEDVIAAHRRMMQKVHPDRGGSDFLAAQVNQAKDLLLGR